MRLWELAIITEEEAGEEEDGASESTHALPFSSKRDTTSDATRPGTAGPGSSMMKIVDANNRNRNMGVVANRRRTHEPNHGDDVEMSTLPSGAGGSKPQLQPQAASAQGWSAQGELRAERLGFAYPSAPTLPVFAALLSVTFKPGQVHAIVGPSGSGKTSTFPSHVFRVYLFFLRKFLCVLICICFYSYFPFVFAALMHLLARLYAPSQGSILLDGVDINRMSRDQVIFPFFFLQLRSNVLRGSCAWDFLFLRN